jgi:hypothetical protein
MLGLPLRALTYTAARALPAGRGFTVEAAKMAAGGVIGGISYDWFKNAFTPQVPDPHTGGGPPSFGTKPQPDPVPPDPHNSVVPITGSNSLGGCLLAGCKSIDFDKLVDSMLSKPVDAPLTINPPPAPTCEDNRLDGLEALRRGANLNSGTSFATRNPAAARTCYYVAAQQNVPIAQFNLADMLLTGDAGVAPDQTRGFEYMEAAARNGFLPAQIRLADAYDRGEGTRPDRGAVFNWFAAAANAGSSYAQFQLSRFYYYGLAGPRDYVGAFIWLNVALMGGYQPASATMKDLLAIVDADARSGIAGAEFTMGTAFESGVPGFISPDPRSAFLAYRAAARGNWLAAPAALQRVCSNAPAACF